MFQGRAQILDSNPFLWLPALSVQHTIEFHPIIKMPDRHFRGPQRAAGSVFHSANKHIASPHTCHAVHSRTDIHPPAVGLPGSLSGYPSNSTRWLRTRQCRAPVPQYPTGPPSPAHMGSKPMLSLAMSLFYLTECLSPCCMFCRAILQSQAIHASESFQEQVSVLL